MESPVDGAGPQLSVEEVESDALGQAEIQSGEFGEVKARLDEIVEAVSSEDISLDDALELYEEAVKLGMRASSLLEEKIG